MGFKNKAIYTSNPFLIKGLKVTKSKPKILKGASTETGEIVNVQTLTNEVIIDTMEYTKVSHKELKTLKLNSVTAHRLFIYLLFNTNIRKDYIVINKEEACEYSSPNSKSTYYRALEELIDNNVIAKSQVNNMFYININLFYNGNRTNLLDKNEIFNEE